MSKNIDNLRPPSTEEARERGQKGGINSGKARNEKRKLREAIEAVLSQKYEVDGQEVTGYVAAALGVFNKAMTQGDPSAFNAIRDLIGEKPAEKVDTTISGAMQFNSGGLRETLEELKKKD